MGNETDSAVIIAKGVCQNFPGSDVKVIGRLIHEEQVGWLKEQLSQGHPGLFTAGQHGNRLAHIVAAEQKAAQGRAQVLLRLRWRGLLQFLNERIVRVEEFKHVLGVIGSDDVVAGLSFPRIDRNDACK